MVVVMVVVVMLVVMVVTKVDKVVVAAAAELLKALSLTALFRSNARRVEMDMVVS